MALYHVQIEYRTTKTWYIEAETENAIRAFVDSGDIETDFDPAIMTEDADVQAVGRVEGGISEKFKDRVISIIPQNPEDRK